MKKIYLVTTNAKKLQTAQKVFSEYGIAIDSVSFETPEIQSFDVKEIASFSAQYVANSTQKNVITTDVGYYIPALNNFPGAYVKQMNHWFSSKQILKLMEGMDDRSFEMRECLAYCEPGKEPITFETISKGVIAKEAAGEGTTLDTIMIRDGHNKVQALYPMEEQIAYYVAHLDHYHKFCKHCLGTKLLETH